MLFNYEDYEPIGEGRVERYTITQLSIYTVWLF